MFSRTDNSALSCWRSDPDPQHKSRPDKKVRINFLKTEAAMGTFCIFDLVVI
jgi:hypothetical protein